VSSVGSYTSILVSSVGSDTSILVSSVGSDTSILVSSVGSFFCYVNDARSPEPEDIRVFISLKIILTFGA